MADLLVTDDNANVASGKTLIRRFHDNGDGTWSEVIHPDATGGGGGGAVTIADGADVAEGAAADAIVAGGAAGSVSAKLRRISSDIASILAGPVIIGGNVASGAADSGNPVKMGGRYNSTVPTLTDGQRADAQLDTRGNLKVTLQSTNNNFGTSFNTSSNDGQGTDGSAVLLKATTIPYAYNGSTFDRVRVPNIFKTVLATASGDTAVWTPTAGKKFRLMKFMIDLTSNANQTVGGLVEILLRDATTATGMGASIFVPTTAVTTGFGGYTTGWIDLGNGILSAAANNVLNVNLSAALATGEIRVVAIGTEE